MNLVFFLVDQGQDIVLEAKGGMDQQHIVVKILKQGDNEAHYIRFWKILPHPIHCQNIWMRCDPPQKYSVCIVPPAYRIFVISL